MTLSVMWFKYSPCSAGHFPHLGYTETNKHKECWEPEAVGAPHSSYLWQQHPVPRLKMTCRNFTHCHLTLCFCSVKMVCASFLPDPWNNRNYQPAEDPAGVHAELCQRPSGFHQWLASVPVPGPQGKELSKGSEGIEEPIFFFGVSHFTIK